jgi:hypothetical protein
VQSEEFYLLYLSPNIVRKIKSRRLKWTGHVACMGAMRNAYKTLVGKFEGKTSFGRWEGDSKMGLKDVRMRSGVKLHRTGTRSGFL